MKIITIFNLVVILLFLGCQQSTESTGGYLALITDSSLYKYNPNGTKLAISLENHTSDSVYLWYSKNNPALWLYSSVGGQWVASPLKNNDALHIGYLRSNSTYKDSTGLVYGKGEFYVGVIGTIGAIDVGKPKIVSKIFKIE